MLRLNKFEMEFSNINEWMKHCNAFDRFHSHAKTNIQFTNHKSVIP